MEHESTSRLASEPLIVSSNAQPSPRPPASPSRDKEIGAAYEVLAGDEQTIPGYNFESLFRKKSHIRLARRKNKEESQKRSLGPRVEVERRRKDIQKGHWTSDESKLYHWFLELHSRHFVYKSLRRTDKIFKSMANFVQTREAEQCRSHHQKMEKKYHSFYRILAKLRNDFYSSASPDPLRAELEEHGYHCAGLISEQELSLGQVQPGPQPQEERPEDSLDSDEGNQEQQSNILSENYEKGLQLRHNHF